MSHQVIGAAIEVHRYLGPGYLESIYAEAMSIKFGTRKLTFRRQAQVAVRYKAQTIGKNRLDLIVEDQLVVELKAVEAIVPLHTSQLISLKATGVSTWLLINFNVPILKAGIRRIILSEALRT